MATAASQPAVDALDERYAAVRRTTEALVEPLETEDFVVQSMPDVSPAKWHIAHVTWFFETFVLKTFADYRVFHPAYEVLFNSYYNAVGEQFPRHQRGLLSRPTVGEVRAYRSHVDEAMHAAFAAGRLDASQRAVVELGLHHEQQHQELLLMDLKHVLSINPLKPAYRPGVVPARTPEALTWRRFEAAERTIGADAGSFAFDNEGPRHRRTVPAFRIAERPVTSGEYIEFIEDGGYDDPALWLSDGWSLLDEAGWSAPLYWSRRDGEYFEFTLRGERPVDRTAPVCHLSYYEADAFATWAGHRLPDEFEWEVAAGDPPGPAGSLGDGHLHPRLPGAGRFFGEVWEWTRSAYQPYPGFRPAAGALGEYNGKFMCSQLVLRGGACVTPADHVRRSYRNFFYPHMRWQFGGLRLADDG